MADRVRVKHCNMSRCVFVYIAELTVMIPVIEVDSFDKLKGMRRVLAAECNLLTLS